jgi:hypothetical protein
MLGCVSELFSTGFTWQHLHNPRAGAKHPYAAVLRQGFVAAKQTIEALPLYASVPMHRSKSPAAALGIDEPRVKDQRKSCG